MSILWREDLNAPAVRVRGTLRSLWSRRGFRRITYAIAAGSMLTLGADWTLHRPFAARLALRQLDRVLREETGLSLRAERMELELLKGRVVLDGLEVGEDLLWVRRLELQVELLSLLGRHPHIPRVVLEDPVLRLDARRLARLRLKPRPESPAKTYLKLGTCQVRGGRVVVDEPLWGLPPLSAGLDVEAHGTGDNRAEGVLRLSGLRAGRGQGLEGIARLDFGVSEEAATLRGSTFVVGATHVELMGQLDFKGGRVRATGSGSAHLAQLSDLAGLRQRPEGRVDFRGDLSGTLKDPHWRAQLQGYGLGLPALGLGPLQVAFRGEGDREHLAVERLDCEGDQLSLGASGGWRVGEGTSCELTVRRAAFGRLAERLRAPFLRPLAAQMTGTLRLPGAPWAIETLDAITVQAACTFEREGQAAGEAEVAMKGGLFRAEGLRLDLPQLGFQGRVEGRLGPKGLRSLDASGRVRTEAAQVAETLRAWEVVTLDMAGGVQVEAEAHWVPARGWEMDGRMDVERPRWHGAQADRLGARVRIRDNQLFLTDLDMAKAEGRASGDLWLSLLRRPAGEDEIDMCFRAFRLPVEEGLKAADLKASEGRAVSLDLPISGIGSASVRIHGPYRRLRLTGTVMAEACEVYGMTVPAFSGDLDYDIGGGILEARDLRVAETLEQLAHGDEAPRGLLALSGQLRMDLERRDWQARLGGGLDSGPLNIPGPRFQARVEARLEGPWTHAFGPMALPAGRLDFQRGRLFVGEQSIEGLSGLIESGEDLLRAKVRSEGRTEPLAELDLWRTAGGLAGALDLKVDASTVETAHLASRLTGDVLRDGRMDLRLQGGWEPGKGLAWEGRLDDLWAGFDGFELAQSRPARVHGNGTRARVDLELMGRDRAAGKGAPPAGTLRLEGGLPLGPDGILDLGCRGAMDLGNLKVVLDRLVQLDPYSLLADLKPTGTAQLDARLGGTYREPLLGGTLGLKGGRLEARTYPQSVEDLSFTLHFQGRDVVVPKEDPVRGTFAQGALQAWGRATWGLGGLSDYAVETRLRDFQFRDIPEGFELMGSLDASLKGNDLDGGLVKGTLNATRMLYRQDLSLGDIIVAGALGGASGLSALDPENPLSRVFLDLELKLSEPWEFDTNLLKLQGRPAGDFRIQGSLAQPGLKGKMAFLPGGRLTNLLPAGDLVLERGTLEFPDPAVFNPVLDLQGRVDVPPYVVNLAIRGSLDGLEWRPTSTPSLRQDEITAILVDPGLASTIGSTSGSTTQAASYGLASTGTGLLTTLALAEFQDRLRRSLNLDRVNVAWRAGTAGNSETSVTLGKSLHLGDLRVPLVFTHRRAGELQTLSGQVEWRLGNLVLQLGASQSGSSGLKPSGELRHTWSPK